MSVRKVYNVTLVQYGDLGTYVQWENDEGVTVRVRFGCKRCINQVAPIAEELFDQVNMLKYNNLTPAADLLTLPLCARCKPKSDNR